MGEGWPLTLVLPVTLSSEGTRARLGYSARPGRCRGPPFEAAGRTTADTSHRQQIAPDLELILRRDLSSVPKARQGECGTSGQDTVLDRGADQRQPPDGRLRAGGSPRPRRWRLPDRYAPVAPVSSIVRNAGLR